MKFCLFKIIIISGWLFFLLIPQVSQGIEIENPLDVESIPELIDNIVQFIFWIAVVLAPLMILVGAFYFITAAGDPKRVETGKKIILWTIVGLAIILFSRGIISIIRSVLAG
ncbi:hypothetical protein KJA17_02695 [Patescibacteria group bacterium]|nr:hypothetical protein [Patescibacteria group bacterium]